MQPTQFADAALAERFWAKVDSRSPHECWEWQAGRHSRGYGIFYLTGHTQILAHRLALALATGTIPEGAYALHSCDNPPCCNPNHLRWGTQAENMHDAASRGRARPGLTLPARCSAGHDLTDPVNIITKTRKFPNGKRYTVRSCRECNRISCARRRAERKEQRNG